MGLTSFADALWGRELLQEAVDGLVSYVLMGLRWLLNFDLLWGGEFSEVLSDGSARRVNGVVGVSYGIG